MNGRFDLVQKMKTLSENLLKKEIDEGGAEKILLETLGTYFVVLKNHFSEIAWL